jgi:thioredoxin 2
LPATRLDQTARCARCKQALLPAATPLEVASIADFDELVTKSPLPVLVDFWAPWCGPCRTVAPELMKIAQQRAGRVVVAKVNTDELREVGARLRIESIPTMILFQQGNAVQRSSGAQSAAAILRHFGI